MQYHVGCMLSRLENYSEWLHYMLFNLVPQWSFRFLFCCYFTLCLRELPSMALYLAKGGASVKPQVILWAKLLADPEL